MRDNEIIVEALKCVAEMLRDSHGKQYTLAELRLLGLADAQTFERLAEKQTGFNRSGIHVTVRAVGDDLDFAAGGLYGAWEYITRMPLQALLNRSEDDHWHEDYNYGWSLEIEGEPCDEGDVRGR